MRRARLSDEDFCAILSEVDTPPHEKDVLRDRLNQIIALARDAAHPTTEDERLFRKFANAPVRLKRPLEKVSKSIADLRHLILKDPDLKTALGIAARRNPVGSLQDLEVALEGLTALDHWAKAALKVERRGRNPDGPMRTALIGLADAFVDHFAPDIEVWELPASEKTEFIKFSAAVLSHVDQRDATEANLRKVWGRLRNEMTPRVRTK